MDCKLCVLVETDQGESFNLERESFVIGKTVPNTGEVYVTSLLRYRY